MPNPSDPFTDSVKAVLPWAMAFLMTVMLIIACGYSQSLEREAIRSNLATYYERGQFVWKEN